MVDVRKEKDRNPTTTDVNIPSSMQIVNNNYKGRVIVLVDSPEGAKRLEKFLQQTEFALGELSINVTNSEEDPTQVFDSFGGSMSIRPVRVPSGLPVRVVPISSVPYQENEDWMKDISVYEDPKQLKEAFEAKGGWF